MVETRSMVNALPPSGNHDAIWVYINNGLSRVLNNPADSLDNTGYINFYTAVYNYCTLVQNSVSDGFSYIPTDAGHGAPGTTSGRELYERLKVSIGVYMSQVVENSRLHTGDGLLTFYNEQWTKFGDSAKLIHNNFSYLNRHWINREQEDGNNVCDVSTLMFQLWRDQFFMQVRNTLLDSVFNLMTRIRNGQVADLNLVKSVVDSFVSLGNDETGVQSKKMEVYDKYFLKPFIEATAKYYRIESDRQLQEGTIIEYMVKVSARLHEEDDRAELYLHESSLTEFKDALNSVLITRVKDKLCAEFVTLLDSREKGDLKRLYTLMGRTGKGAGLDPLRDLFGSYVKSAGLEAVNQVSSATSAEGASSASNDARQFVLALLSVYDLYAELLHDSFNDDPGFSKSLDYACREFFNVNKMCPEEGSRAPQLLAQYCDTLLKKGSGNVRTAGAEIASDEDALEAQLSQAVSVYRFIKAPDVFQKFYAQHLARRLVYEQSVSSHGEETMISKLKEVSGVDFTSKLSRMFTDMTVSKEMSDEFKERCRETNFNLPFDLDMKILHTVSWPLNAPETKLVLPPQLSSVCDKYTHFYQAKHNRRKLNWMWQHSKAEIKMFFPKATGPAAKAGYIFMVSTYQLAILMLFNAESGPGTGYDSPSGPTLTLSQISQATGLDNSTITSEIDSICRARVLIGSNSDNEPTDDTTYKLNADFKSKRLRVNFAGAKKQEQKREITDTMRSINVDRMYTIQAAIVRIMKARKQLSHRQLVEDTISQIKLFQAPVADIKKGIDTLIDKEYLERSEGSRDVYNYLA
ncbi:ubiquitin ligase (cullin) of SCF [Kickxella alabastrina]|uniref:Ubiquitin ligase (Cullin) of SCF n=1 Tax=Kickxella alabastrina TaxID=61397 RepID=A0ACC1IWF7_9FUNG|nr:ubiquitin ligase (cullin) of SCF [Kickxella alabastrina]